MKKTYLKPETVVNMLHMENMLLAGSPTAGVDPTGSVDAASIESRGYSDWDDED